MKTNLRIRAALGGMKRSFALGAVLVLFAATQTTRAASAAELLEKGIYTEETKGELEAASAIYRQIVDEPGADRSLVAQAQLRLGLCELKLGNKPQAISALERLTQEFPDKDTLLTLVGQHMPQLLEEMVQQIEQNYLQEVDRSELMETALRAIVGKLDARGGLLRSNDMAFLSARELTQINESIEQKIGGIGAALRMEESELVVTTPLPNSPALKGGLQAGDRIIKINGEELSPDMKLEAAVKLLRGPAGTSVTLGVKRAGLAQPLDIQLVRDIVRLSSVLGGHYKSDNTWDFMLDEPRKIGYVRLTQIGKQSPEEMQSALQDLKARGLKALILDLRNNPGGTLSEAISVSDLFVDSGRIVTVKGRAEEQVYDAKADGTFSGFPMVLVVNRKTASAAEIVVACLQDHQRATVVGERTYGQALVRSLIPLKGGTGALKLPVAAYYRPSGKNMNRYPDAGESEDWGVRPDAGFEVVMTEEELKQYEGDRSERDRLNNPQTRKSEFLDRQLQKAFECILAQLENK